MTAFAVSPHPGDGWSDMIVHAKQALAGCLLYFCDYGDVGRQGVAALVKQLGGRVRASGSPVLAKDSAAWVGTHPGTTHSCVVRRAC